MEAGEEELSAKWFIALSYLIKLSHNLGVDSIVPILQTKTEFQKFYATYLNLTQLVNDEARINIGLTDAKTVLITSMLNSIF